MKSACHCNNGTAPSPARKGLSSLRWIVPGTILALMPKCPMCFAAYIALATGVGLSLPVAAALRTCLILISVASLAFLVIHGIRKRRAALPPH